MKIVKISGVLPIIQSRAYKKRLYNLVVSHYDTNQMQVILNDYSMNDIEDAINEIYISQDGYICSPEYNKSSFILRLLQFGGYKIKALNLLTLAIDNRRVHK